MHTVRGRQTSGRTDIFFGWQVSCFATRRHASSFSVSCVRMYQLRCVLRGVPTQPLRVHTVGFFNQLRSTLSPERSHQEQRIIGYVFQMSLVFLILGYSYSPEQVFDVVADVSQYSQFLPWCRRSVIVRNTNSGFDAELEVGFGPIVERYMSHVEIDRPRTVVVRIFTSETRFRLPYREHRASRLSIPVAYFSICAMNGDLNQALRRRQRVCISE